MSARSNRCRLESAAVLAALLGAALALGAPAAASAQEEDSDAQTRMERELERPGRLVVERRRPLPPVRLRGGASLVVVSVQAAEPGREQALILGVRVELRGASSFAAHLDVYEIDTVIRAIDYMAMQLHQGKLDEAEPTELRVRTVDGLVLGMVAEKGRVRRFVQVEDSPRLAADAEAFERLRSRLVQARQMLFEGP